MIYSHLKIILIHDCIKTFFQATQQMEEKLLQFINEHSNYDPSDSHDAVARFVHRQVIHIAEDCLSQSRKQLITSHYFFEMSENLEKLLIEVCLNAVLH